VRRSRFYLIKAKEVIVCDDFDEDERVCPCGCNDDIEHCSYASVCNVCGRKYAGHGYCVMDAQCSKECVAEYEWTHPKVD
jgi:hypothetical protein